MKDINSQVKGGDMHSTNQTASYKARLFHCKAQICIIASNIISGILFALFGSIACGVVMIPMFPLVALTFSFPDSWCTAKGLFGYVATLAAITFLSFIYLIIIQDKSLHLKIRKELADIPPYPLKEGDQKIIDCKENENSFQTSTI